MRSIGIGSSQCPAGNHQHDNRPWAANALVHKPFLGNFIRRLKRASGPRRSESAALLAVLTSAWVRCSHLQRRLQQRRNLDGRIGRRASKLEADGEAVIDVGMAEQLASETRDRDMVACFRVDHVEEGGFGAIATRDIAAGELVTAETPTLYMSSESAKYPPIQVQFDALPKSTQKSVMALHDSLSSNGEKSLEGISGTNAHCRNEQCSESVICLLCSRFNHSCTPNCEQNWDEERGMLTILASTRIREGEQLCISYLELRRTAADRVGELWERYHFQCNCCACAGASAASDHRRVRLMELDGQIGSLGGTDTSRSIRLVTDTLELLDAEGLHLNDLRQRECSHASRLAMFSGCVGEARVWAEKALSYCLLFYGPGHAETLRLRREAEDLAHQSRIEGASDDENPPSLLGVLPMLTCLSALCVALIAVRLFGAHH